MGIDSRAKKRLPGDGSSGGHRRSSSFRAKPPAKFGGRASSPTDLRITGGSDAETTLYPGGAQRTTLRSHPPLPPCSRGLPKTIGPFFNRGFCIFLFLVKEYREAGRGAASGTAAAGSALVLLPISAHRDNEQRPAGGRAARDQKYETTRTILGLPHHHHPCSVPGGEGFGKWGYDMLWACCAPFVCLYRMCWLIKLLEPDSVRTW